MKYLRGYGMKLKYKKKKNSVKIVFKLNDYILYDKEGKTEIKGIVECLKDILQEIKGSDKH